MTRIMHMIVPVLEDSTAQQWAQAHEKTTIIKCGMDMDRVLRNTQEACLNRN